MDLNELKKFVANKLSILDVKAEDNEGNIYDIEIQQAGNSNYRNRALYTAKKISYMQEGAVNLSHNLKSILG